MSFTIDDVVLRHRELTADIATISARHKTELEPLTTAVTQIEAWLLAKMNADGIQNYKTPHGTAYQSRLKSVKLEDPVGFRNFILYPAAAHIQALVSGSALFADQESGINSLLNIMGQYPQWDCADFRPGKKGILKHQEDTGQVVPGISFTEIVNVNVRGS